MKRAELVAEALRALDSAIAMDNTPPDSPDIVDGHVGYLLGRMLGAGEPLDYRWWSRDSLAALLTAVVQQVPDDALESVVDAMRAEANWHDSYRVYADLEDHGFEREVVPDVARMLTPAQEDAARARRVRREQHREDDHSRITIAS